eukprot:7188829-Heterocapsa_arctica.AAC.1
MADPDEWQELVTVLRTTLQEYHDFVLNFVEQHCDAPHRSLNRILKAQSETHSLWAESMRTGQTDDEAPGS